MTDPERAGATERGPRDPRKAEFEANKLRKRLRRLVGAAIADFGLIESGDRVMVCLSGGKDSYGLLDVLLSLRDRAPLPFEIILETPHAAAEEKQVEALVRALSAILAEYQKLLAFAANL